MTTQADAINVAGAREVYEQPKERIRLLIVGIDRSNAE
jgi:hypothetical protein